MKNDNPYTPELTKALVEGYYAKRGIAALAYEFGKTEKSIIAKLVQLGVYVSTATDKPKRKTKLQMLTEIESILGLEAGLLASLEKGTTESVSALHVAVTNILN